jgi:Ca2+-binding EF-hand superfamily protein
LIALLALSPFAPAADPAKPSGGVAATAGQPLGRGSPKPARPRAEAFVAGVGPWETSVSRTFPPFQHTGVTIPDTLDVVFFARQRPIRVRVVVRTAGKTLAARWEENLRKLFASVDRDSDGFLNRYELDFMFPVSGVSQMLAGGFYYRAGNAPVMEAVDVDADDRVSFAEFAQYYKPAAAEVVRPRPTPVQAFPADTTTQELFARLDRTGDGRLTQDELKAAEKILLALDTNEDECVSAQELLSNPSRPQTVVAVAPPAMAAQPARPSGPQPQEVLVFPAGVPETVVPQLVKRYDKDKDEKLTREELGVEAAAFEALDTDKDGKLTAKELDGWRKAEPDAVVTLELGEKPADCRAAIARPGSKPLPANLELRQTESRRLVLRVGPQSIEFGAFFPPESVRRQVAQNVASPGVFGDKQFVVEQDLIGPQNQFLRVVFDAADFDSDGRLTKAEFDRYFAMQRGTSELGLAFTSVVRTPNLFQLLDENLDGKLSVRELRTAWDRMIVLEPADAKAVTKAILQPSATLQLTPAIYAGYDPNQFGQMGEGPKASPTGPLWFRKMDRNADGDVSRAEFLAAEPDFVMLDANKDGLISVAEAEEYETKARPKKKPEPKKKEEAKKKEKK